MIDEPDTNDLGPHESELFAQLPHESELFAQLPRESAPDPASTDQLVTVLRREGFFHRNSWRANRALQLAAAALLFAGGALAGARFATRNSLERALARTDLTVPDRILLLQRAGSAYVTAAHGYADATAHADSTAVEVANQVLRGAAHAVMKSNLNSTLSASLVAVLQTQPSTPPKPLLWY